MSEKITTLEATTAKFLGDWEDEATGCAMRDGRFTVTDAAKHAESIQQMNAEADALAAETRRQANAQAADC